MTAGRAGGYVLLGLAGLLFAIAVLSGWSGAQRLVGREDDTGAVEHAAAAFVTAYGTFDHREQYEYTARLVALTSGPLHEALAQATVAPDAARLQRAIATRVESVSLTALSDGDATASVTAVQERRWVDPVLDTSHSEVVTQRVTCRLVRGDGRWLVVELRLQSEEPARLEAR